MVWFQRVAKGQRFQFQSAFDGAEPRLVPKTSLRLAAPINRSILRAETIFGESVDFPVLVAFSSMRPKWVRAGVGLGHRVSFEIVKPNHSAAILSHGDLLLSCVPIVFGTQFALIGI